MRSSKSGRGEAGALDGGAKTTAERALHCRRILAHIEQTLGNWTGAYSKTRSNVTLLV